MRIGRTVPPAAAPLGWRDCWSGMAGILSPERALGVLEDEVRREFGVAHVFLVSSGTSALAVTLTALRSLTSRREVIIPAYTCYSVPAAVLKAGLRPVLCDINPSSFDFDLEQLETRLGDDTLCVVATHLFGIPAAVATIRALCAPRGIFVVEDAAQAMGAEHKGRKLGTLGDAGVFSLGRGKNITCGSGGIVVTSAPRIAAALDNQFRRLTRPSIREQIQDWLRLVLMMIFIRPWLYWIPAAIPFLELGRTIFPTDISIARLSGMKAGLLRNWRSRLAGSNRLRAETAAYFSRQLALQPAVASPHPYLRLPVAVGTAAEREWIQGVSRKHGLGVSLAYPMPLNEIPELRATFNGQSFPAARKVAEQLLTLPTHHWLSAKDKRAIAAVCRRACSGRINA